jgi:hypothetical protein
MTFQSTLIRRALVSSYGTMLHEQHNYCDTKHKLTRVGCAMAEAVSGQFTTVAARVLTCIKSRGICGGQSGTGAHFRRVLRFPLQILIPPTAPHSSAIIRCWYNRPIGGRRTEWTVSPHLKKILDQTFTNCLSSVKTYPPQSSKSRSFMYPHINVICMANSCV